MILYSEYCNNAQWVETVRNGRVHIMDKNLFPMNVNCGSCYSRLLRSNLVEGSEQRVGISECTNHCSFTMIAHQMNIHFLLSLFYGQFRVYLIKT